MHDMPARTELFIRARTKAGTPEAVLYLLDYPTWMGGLALPDHQFFAVKGFESVLHGGAEGIREGSGVRWGTATMPPQMVLHSRFVNDGNLLALFMDWLTPHLIVGQGFIGYSLFEQHDKPQLYFV